jgi:hypothetical protein
MRCTRQEVRWELLQGAVGRLESGEVEGEGSVNEIKCAEGCTVGTTTINWQTGKQQIWLEGQIAEGALVPSHQRLRQVGRRSLIM